MSRTRVGVGQDSHRFLGEDSSKLFVMGGVIFENTPGLSGDTDADVVFHAICKAIASLTHISILSGIAIELRKKDGITDSSIFLKEALATLGRQKVEHVALTIEGKRPRIQGKIDEIRSSVAKAMNIEVDQVGLTATSGDGLTDFSCGDGLQCFCILTTVED